MCAHTKAAWSLTTTKTNIGELSAVAIIFRYLGSTSSEHNMECVVYSWWTSAAFNEWRRSDRSFCVAIKSALHIHFEIKQTFGPIALWKLHRAPCRDLFPGHNWLRWSFSDKLKYTDESAQNQRKRSLKYLKKCSTHHLRHDRTHFCEWSFWNHHASIF